MSGIEAIRAQEKLENGGRGVSCVRSVLTYLDRGDRESAFAVFHTDFDKVRNYPALAKLLKAYFCDCGTAGHDKKCPTRWH